jgi:hypothetical protein
MYCGFIDIGLQRNAMALYLALGLVAVAAAAGTVLLLRRRRGK